MLHLCRKVALLGAPLALSGCWGISGDGDRERETRDLSDFVRIESHGELDVEVRRADAFHVGMSIDSNLLDNVETSVRDETLIIDQNINFIDIVPGPHVTIAMPDLMFVHLYGSGDLDATSFDATETLRLELSGSGDLRFEGSAPRIEGDVEGSGDLHLSGSTDFADLVVRGSGNIEARDLEAAQASLRVEGSGDIAVTLTGEADARIRGSGDIDLYGDVALRHSDDDGSGDIRVH